MALQNGFPIGPGESYTWKSVGSIHAVASTGSAGGRDHV